MREPQIADEGATGDTAHAKPRVEEQQPPKARLSEWCGKRKLAAPAFDLTPGPQEFEVRVRVTLKGEVTLESAMHRGRSIKIAQNAACADVLEQVERREDLPAAIQHKRQRKRPAEKSEVTAEARAVAEAARAAAKERAIEERAAAKQKVRGARDERARRIIETSAAAAARRALQELRGLQWIRGFAVETQNQGRGLPSFSVAAWLERQDGGQIHVPAFVAASRAEGERIACAQLLEALACTEGVPRARRLGERLP